MKTRIIAYNIVSSTSAEKLAELVTQKISEGWQPHGTLVHQGNALSGSYSQAVIRHAES